ncbi:MAG: hypothetical protein ACLR71_13735 [[Clostridium] scindens]
MTRLIYRVTEGIMRGQGKASGGVKETMTWSNKLPVYGRGAHHEAEQSGRIKEPGNRD